MSKPILPVSDARFSSWLERLIGTPLHKPTVKSTLTVVKPKR